MHYVYIAQSPSGLIKVGESIYPPQRLRQIASVSGGMTMLRHIEIDTYIQARTVEHYLLTVCKKFKSHGEWLTAEAKQILESIPASFKDAEGWILKNDAEYRKNNYVKVFSEKQMRYVLVRKYSRDRKKSDKWK